MNARLNYALALSTLAIATQAAAQVTFYEQDNFQGRSFTTESQVRNFERDGFNERASSVEVIDKRWEVCDERRFRGRCVVLRPGRYTNPASMGLNDSISSVRPVSANARIDERRYAPAPVVVAAVTRVTFFEYEGFGGRSFTADRPINNFERFGFNDRASSVEVVGGPWEVCDDLRFNGRCVVLRPGRYSSLAAMGLNDRVSSVRSVSPNARIDESRYAPAPAAAVASEQITFYEREGFGGRPVTIDRPIDNFERNGINDRASSIEVISGTWEACENARFDGRCVILRPGRYPSLAAMGLNDRISSVRPISANAIANDPRYAAARATPPDFRQRNDERLYDVNVTSVRAIVGPPEQRCWLEREEVVQDRSNSNVPGAIAGALIGGILGHQVGGGTGKDLATVGGAIAGAAIGANTGRAGGAQPAALQNVQRCETVPSQAQPSSWDVSYNFRGQEHRVQMSAPPGRTITVNDRGEPRR